MKNFFYVKNVFISSTCTNLLSSVPLGNKKTYFFPSVKDIDLLFVQARVCFRAWHGRASRKGNKPHFSFFSSVRGTYLLSWRHGFAYAGGTVMPLGKEKTLVFLPHIFFYESHRSKKKRENIFIFLLREAHICFSRRN